MKFSPTTKPAHPIWEFAGMCRPDGVVAAKWLAEPTTARLVAAFLMILLGGGLYGFSVGFWRAPEMGAYVAIKLPVLLVAITLCNGLLNGILAQLYGANLTFRQSLLSSLLSFAIFSTILGALSPIIFSLALGLEPAGSAKEGTSYAIILLVNVLCIAAAGILSHSRFLPGLSSILRDTKLAKRVFFTWLAGNLFVGAQLSWNLRPFCGHPSNPPTFIRPNWNEGNFYETVATHAQSLFADSQMWPGSQPILILLAIALIANHFGKVTKPTPTVNNQ